MPSEGWLVEVWRQVSRHLDVTSCCDQLWASLGERVPAERMWIRRVERGHRWLETVAVTPWEPSLAARASRSPVTVEQLDALGRWASDGRVGRPPEGLAAGLHPSPEGAWSLGALRDEEGLQGVVIFDRPALTPDLLIALLEPLAVALRNDRRVHELAQLREAVEAENRALLTRLARDGISGRVVGAEAGLADVMDRVGRVGPTDAPVLLLGETGTGKELVARELHERSARRAGPFLKVNCGAIPAELVDSELFGHERGSFTGAVSHRRGWFERADGGTLFLDEIGELPAAAQVRLLRVLQDGTFERVGGGRPLHADVRLVAATHRDLREMVAAGTFREDLWYRIGVFPIRLPPLRERPGDIPLLAAHFAAGAGERLHGRALPVTAADLALLSGYDWPGNVRELAAVIERSAILGDGHRLEVAAALGGAQGSAPRVRASLPALDQVQRQAIEETLRKCSGRVEGPGGAAERLGLRPSTLRSRMEKLGIPWRAYRARGSA